MREAFAPALRVAERLATGDQRDAGILCICGLIHGESGDYSEEQAAYRSAISLDEQFGDAHQYLAYSISCQLRDRLEDEGRADVGYEDLKPDEQEMVGAVLQHCEQAKRLNQYQSWVYFDEASELSRWARLDEAVELLLRAVQMNPAVRHYIRTEPYFGPILDRPEVAKILGEI